MSTIYTMNFVKKLFFQLIFVPLLLLSIILYKCLFTAPSKNRNLPPSPPKLPILGNLHQLGKFPHRSLQTLSKKYGGLMSIKIGSVQAIVVSSADAACDIMKTHDAVFANRPKSRVMCKIIYGGKDLVFSPYGEYWRQIRSICVLQLLSTKKVLSFRNVREEEVSFVIDLIRKSSNLPVNMTKILMMLSSNFLCRCAYGRKYDGETGLDFGKLLAEFVEAMGAISMGDYIPWLGWIDRVSGLDKKVENVAKKFDDFLERVVQEHMACEDTKDENSKDFVDILLDVRRENPDALPKDSIKAIILDMFAAGTDTTFTLLEWAMTELLGHPDVLKTLQDEVRQVVKQKAMVDEDDLENMPYVKAVLKETLRLHPPLPVLLFRQVSTDVTLQGYDIAANTQVIINAWAIHRDPTYWERPDEFWPDRFLNSSLDLKVPKLPIFDFNWIPFGGGRRGCPGAPFALAGAELALANLVYAFDWKLPDGAEADASKLHEHPGITVNRRNPLIAIANLHDNV